MKTSTLNSLFVGLTILGQSTFAGTVLNGALPYDAHLYPAYNWAHIHMIESKSGIEKRVDLNKQMSFRAAAIQSLLGGYSNSLNVIVENDESVSFVLTSENKRADQEKASGFVLNESAQSLACPAGTGKIYFNNPRVVWTNENLSPTMNKGRTSAYLTRQEKVVRKDGKTEITNYIVYSTSENDVGNVAGFFFKAAVKDNAQVSPYVILKQTGAAEIGQPVVSGNNIYRTIVLRGNLEGLELRASK
jgi:hypothetical protein